MKRTVQLSPPGLTLIPNQDHVGGPQQVFAHFEHAVVSTSSRDREKCVEYQEGPGGRYKHVHRPRLVLVHPSNSPDGLCIMSVIRIYPDPMIKERTNPLHPQQ